MYRTILVAVVFLFAGLAVARWLPSPAATPAPATAPATAPVPAPGAFDADAPLEQRVRELERAVSEEREARQLLADELVYLNGELDRQFGGGSVEPADALAAVDTGTAAAAPRSRSRRNSPEGRTARLIEAGFAADRAAWIVRRESQLQMEALQSRYEAEQSGDRQSFADERRARAEALRQDLGDAEYERYLAATGRSTSVAISNVMDSSPAQRAGLMPGDEIVRYGGERIYNMSDLNRATYGGQPGETVVVDVLRDGTRLQLSLPRGPVGISGAGRFRAR